MRSFMLVAAFLLVAYDSGFACTCVPPKGPAQELEQSDAVFSGKVVEIKRNPNDQEGDFFAAVEAVFEVEASWKGVETKTVSVFTSSNSAACGYGFKRGTAYLVYATMDNKERLVTTICSRTRRMVDAKEDIDELGPGSGVRSWRTKLALLIEVQASK